MAWKNSKTMTCSQPCRAEMMLCQTIKKYEKIIGEPLELWLLRNYIDKLWSYRDIIKALGIQNVSALIKIMHYFNIPIRHGSEAVATQYIKNPKRRELARAVFIANNLPPKKGEPNNAQLPGVGDKISRAKKGHPMYKRKFWYDNVCRSIQIRCQKQSNTSIEQIMESALKKAGIPFTRQKPIDHYSIDFAIEIHSHKVAIECDSLYWHTRKGRKERDAKRDRILYDFDWTVLRFSNHDILYNIAGCLKVIRASIA